MSRRQMIKKAQEGKKKLTTKERVERMSDKELVDTWQSLSDNERLSTLPTLDDLLYREMRRRNLDTTIKKAQEGKKKLTPAEWVEGLSDEELLKQHRHLRDMGRESLFPETTNAMYKEMSIRNLKPLRERAVHEEMGINNIRNLIKQGEKKRLVVLPHANKDTIRQLTKHKKSLI